MKKQILFLCYRLLTTTAYAEFVEQFRSEQPNADLQKAFKNYLQWWISTRDLNGNESTDRIFSHKIKVEMM